MTKRSVIFSLCFVLLSVIAYARMSVNRMSVLRLSDGQTIEFDRMVAEISDSRLIFVGENHDSSDDHRAQLAIIRKLHKTGKPVAIGMEMFTSASQETLDRWVAGTMETKEFIPFFRREWAMPWHLYREILIYARDNHIPVIGLNVPRQTVGKVARQGFAALTPEERQKLPPGVTCTIDPVYMRFIERAYRQHAGSHRRFTYFCEAQMLWNKSMAFHLSDFLARHPQHLVVVLAGSGHVLKPGIPEEVRSSGYRCSVILPDMVADDISSTDTDYLILFGHAGQRRKS